MEVRSLPTMRTWSTNTWGPSATVNVRLIAVTSVTVAPPSSNIAVGGAVQLVPTVLSGTTVLTNRAVGWTSSNDAVAVVSSTGRVTGLKAGVVTITATSEGVSGTATIIVGITSVVITPSPTSVAVGQTRQLTAVARDASNAAVTGVTFVWASVVPAESLVIRLTASIGTVSGSVPVTVTK